MISLYPFDGPCAACQCVVTVGKGHRSRLPTSDPASEGVDGRPGYEVGWLVHAYYLEECTKCGYFAPRLSTPYPALADVARAREELLSVQARGGHAPDALRFIAVASLFGDADPRQAGSWLLRAAWVDEEGDLAESARPLRLRAAALLEDALYEGYAFAPSRLGSSLALAESLRIGGAFDRALEHCARGLRFSKGLPSGDRKAFLFETWCVLQRRVDPLTRGAALAGYAALDGPTTNGIVERLRATAAELDPIRLRPQRTFHHPTIRTSRSFSDEAALFAADFMDGDLMIDLLRQGHTGVWETVCLRPHYFPELLAATDHAEPAVRKQALHALYNHSFPFEATVLEGHVDSVDALVRRLGDAEEEPVRFAAAILKQVVRIDASFTARVVRAAAAAAALPRWKADLSTTGALERLVDLGTVLIGGPDRRARTVVEMYFAASLRSCVTCGAPPRSLALSANGDRRTLRGPCRFCGTPASFGFFVEDDPEKNTPPSRELGGPEPSKVVTAAELASELGRLKEIGIDADTRGRALTCVLELLKQPDMDASARAARIEDRDRWLLEDAPQPLATLLSRPNVRCAWARVPPRAPFQVSKAESPATYRWSADGSKLWTYPERPGAEWSQWDRHTGDRLRRARVPDDVALPFLPYDVATALVGRKPNGRAARTILSCSPDLRRVVLADSHGEGYGKLCNVADGSLLATLSGMTRPFAFSADGEKLVAPALGKRALLIVSAEDGAPIAEVPFTESLSSLTEASWAPGGELLFNIQVPGHDDDRLLCFSVDQQRTLWSEAGYFPSMQISRVSNSVAAFTRDGAVRIWNIPSGVMIRSIAKEDVRRPLLCGEPDVQAQCELLRHHPVRFSIVPAITSLRPFAGGKKLASSQGLFADTAEPLPAEPLPWRPMDDGEVRAAMGKLRIPAASCNAGPVASDGSFAIFFLHRNEREVPSPDAGTLYESDPSVSLWDRQASAWRWETSSAPDPFMLRWLCGHGHLELSWDESGLFARGSGHPRSSMLYDVATGTLRAPHAGDVPPSPPDAPSASVLASDRSRRWSLVAHAGALEVWDLRAKERFEAIDLASIDDTPTVAAFLDGARFVVGTTNGRVLRFDILESAAPPSGQGDE